MPRQPDNDLNLSNPSQAQLDAIYLRSVNSFFCPKCLMGFCRVDQDSHDNKPYHEWVYTCDKCGATGTETELRSETCVMCGTKLINGHCPTGCNDNAVTLAILGVYAPRPAIEPRCCPECGQVYSQCECPITTTHDEHVVYGQA